MTALNIFFKQSVIDSVLSLDRELDNYFQESISYRSRARKGTVVIVDKSPSLYAFLDMLISKCNLKMCVYHVEDIKIAKKVIAELGEENVKVAVINSDFLVDPVDNTNLAQWVSEYFPAIPIWVSDCPPGHGREIRKTSQRVGIIPKGEPIFEYVGILGFPSKCKAIAKELKLA
jgi:hypothetical protein